MTALDVPAPPPPPPAPAAAATAGTRSFRVSDRAISRIRDLRERQGGAVFRVSVSGGGCSGFQYGFGFDEGVRGDDRVFERDGVTVVVDEVSLELLDGAELDFVEELIGATFQIANPNAKSSCGCGVSFAI